jgi:hypothetical protein
MTEFLLKGNPRISISPARGKSFALQREPSESYFQLDSLLCTKKRKEESRVVSYSFLRVREDERLLRYVTEHTET